MQGDEWRIIISISSGNRCENLARADVDVPCNKGNYVPREPDVRASFAILSDIPRWNLLLDDPFPRAFPFSPRFVFANEIQNTPPSFPHLFHKKIFAKRVLLFVAEQAKTGNLFLCGTENLIFSTLHCVT